MKKFSIKTCRRTLQIAVALAFIAIPYLNRQRIHLFYGNLLSFNAAGLPLADPLAAFQTVLKSFHLPTDLLVGGAIALAIAVCLGTVFCSWACPFGLLSEWVYALSMRVLPKGYRGISIGRSGFTVRIVLFGFAIVGFILIFETPVLNQISMPGWYSRIFQLFFQQGHMSFAVLLVAAILLVEFSTGSRVWCRFICPQASLLALTKLLNPLRLKVCRQEERCRCSGSGPCVKSCSLGLDPKAPGNSFEMECTNCGDCVTACKKVGGALRFKGKAENERLKAEG